MLPHFAQEIATWNWLEFVKTIPSIGTLAIAWVALKSWKSQDKAKRQADFLDTLLDTIHDYATGVSKVATIIGFVRIGMQSQVSSLEKMSEDERVWKGAIDYIKRDRKRDAEILGDALSELSSVVTRLRSLEVKGRVLGLPDYIKCRDSVKLLVWQYGRMMAFRSMIGNPTLNWENPHVLRTLEGVLTVTPESIDEYMTTNTTLIIEFAQEAYRKLFG